MRTHDVYSELFLSNYTQSLLVNNLIPFSFVFKKNYSMRAHNISPRLFVSNDTHSLWVNKLVPSLFALKKNLQHPHPWCLPSTPTTLCIKRHPVLVSEQARSFFVCLKKKQFESGLGQPPHPFLHVLAMHRPWSIILVMFISHHPCPMRIMIVYLLVSPCLCPMRKRCSLIPHLLRDMNLYPLVSFVST